MSTVTQDHYRSQNVAQGGSLKPVSVSIAVVGNNLGNRISLTGQMTVELLDIDGNAIITTNEQSVYANWQSSGQSSILRVQGTQQLDLSKSYAEQIRITMQYMSLNYNGSALPNHKATFNGPVRLMVVRNGQTEPHATPELSPSQYYFDLSSQYTQTKTVGFTTGSFPLGEDVTSLLLAVNFNIIP
jgi:hypothetical protein